MKIQQIKKEKTMMTATLYGKLSTETEMDFSNLASGMYYVIVTPGRENAQIMKVVKN